MTLRPRTTNLVGGAVYDQASIECTTNVPDGQWLLLSVPFVRLKAIGADASTDANGRHHYHVKTVPADHGPEAARVYLLVSPRIIVPTEAEHREKASS
jgi:hypothetical protein